MPGKAHLKALIAACSKSVKTNLGIKRRPSILLRVSYLSKKKNANKLLHQILMNMLIQKKKIKKRSDTPFIRMCH